MFFCYRDLGQHHRVIELYEQVLGIAREWHDCWTERDALLNLGIAYGHLGESQRAIKLYEQVLVIVQEIDDRPKKGDVLGLGKWG